MVSQREGRAERATVFFSRGFAAWVRFCTGVKMPLPSLASTSALADKTPAPPAMSWAKVALKVNADVKVITTTREKAEGLIIGSLRICS
jgi:hypothetical protein